MSAGISAEAQVFLASLLLGGKLMLVYLGLCLFRVIIPHRRCFRDAEDILFWLFCAARAWELLFWANDGSIRWYFLAGIALGMITCREILGKPLKKLAGWVTIKKSAKGAGEYEALPKEKK